uniref:Uncharacterized protein n=2 Tax=Arundo donax TaxID=35708 RepID=A0A0A9F4L6_ARUDO
MRFLLVHGMCIFSPYMYYN